jgi:hypothetical protein
MQYVELATGNWHLAGNSKYLDGSDFLNWQLATGMWMAIRNISMIKIF